METKNRRWDAPVFFFFLALFLGLCCFFILAHPLPLLDTDDWAYFCGERVALPIPRFWNPGRILPETLMPLCGIVTALLSRLLFHDYIQTQMLVVGGVYSLFILLYLYAFFRLLRQRFDLPRGQAMLLTLLFLTLHFLVFRTAESGNKHLFSTLDTACVFFYAIPALLSSSLVLFDLAGDLPEDLYRPGRVLGKGLFLAALYLATFSNLYGSVIFAGYTGCRLLWELLGTLRRKASLASFCRTEALRLTALGLWFLALLAEALGGRGSGAALHGDRLLAAWRNTLRLLGGVSPFALAFMALALLALLLLAAKRPDAAPSCRRGLAGLLILTIAGCVLTAVFVLLLSAVVNPTYVQRPDAVFGVFFFLFLSLCAVLAETLRRRERLGLLLPLLLLVLASAVNTKSMTFADSNCLNLPSRVCVDVDNALIDQLLQAQEWGETQAVSSCMDSDNDWNNWPHNTGQLDSILANGLWKHGVLNRPMTVTLQPSEEFTQAFGLTFTSGEY